MAQFTMPATLMPFLYQTRTIQTVARVRLNLTRTNSPSPSLRCGLHTTARHARDDIPFELPPDIDLSRFDPPSDPEAGLKDTITPTERLAFEKMFRDIAERGQKPKLPKVAPLASVQEKPAPAASRLLAALQAGGRAGAASDNREDIAFNINTIVGDAAMRQKKAQPGLPGLDSLSPLAATYSAAEREAALLRFPPTLRRAARTAFGMLDAAPQPATVYLDGDEAKGDADPVETAPGLMNDQFERTVRIEAQRREERLRIAAQMDACSDDFELWGVIERDVFSLVGRLGITDTTRKSTPSSLPSPPPKPLKRGRRKKGMAQEGMLVQVQAEEEVQPEEQAEEVRPEEQAEPAPQAVLNMEVYGPLYPQLLLESLNKLDSKFARPSPYVAHLLPRVKNQGLVSYVLGVSTSFYNRLMSLMWSRYGDAAGVLALLEEMRHAGLFFDENSRSLVSTIQHAYSQAESRQVGHFKSKLMDMPEYESLVGRLNHWVGHIDRSMKERRIGWRVRNY